MDRVATHDVFNQVPPLAGHDVTAADPALAAGLPNGVDADLHTWGRLAGSAAIIVRMLGDCKLPTGSAVTLRARGPVPAWPR